MSWEPIQKDPRSWKVPPNLLCYEKTCAEFSWAAIRRELEGLPGGRGLNIAHEAVDRHANDALRDRLALRWISKDGTIEDFTYRDLKEKTDRFANLLGGLGVAKGDAVFALAGRIPNFTSRRWARSRTAACSVPCSRPSDQNHCNNAC